MTTREDRFALDLANGVASLKELLYEYAADILREYRGLPPAPAPFSLLLNTYREGTPAVITAGDTGAAAEKT